MRLKDHMPAMHQEHQEAIPHRHLTAATAQKMFRNKTHIMAEGHIKIMPFDFDRFRIPEKCSHTFSCILPQIFLSYFMGDEIFGRATSVSGCERSAFEKKEHRMAGFYAMTLWSWIEWIECFNVERAIYIGDRPTLLNV